MIECGDYGLTVSDQVDDWANRRLESVELIDRIDCVAVVAAVVDVK